MTPGGATPTLDLAPIARIVDAGDASPAACRQALAAGDEAVHAAFGQGVPARHLLAGRTAVVDLVLARLWRAEGEPFEGLALVAVGGYGRAELHPHSDIDLTILLPDDGGGGGDGDDDAAGVADRARRDAVLTRWLTALWDLNLKIGHSVRTVDESAREAAADLTVITNLMEARLIAGEPALLAAVELATAPARMWDAGTFFHAKLAERTARHRRFGLNAYRLEPDVKESKGGLRDIQTIAWVCQRHFGYPPSGTSALAPLVDEGLLEIGELERLTDGLELVWRVRYLLHRYAGRTEDRLLFDYQRRIAHALDHDAPGRHGQQANADIEALMQRYYRTVISLQRLTDICLQGMGGILSGTTANSDIVPINSRFQRRRDVLEASSDEVFLHYPGALLELFVVFAGTPEVREVRSRTVRLVRAHLRLINDRFRSDPAMRALFVSIFRVPAKLTRTVRLMNHYGVLAAYLPAFDAIVGRMQYDLFHIYTVDEHTLHVIRNLRRFSVPEHAGELPLCSEIAARIEQPHVLYLIGLFHDIAKGRGGDHSELGAGDIARFAVDHGFDGKTIELMRWSVHHHLAMSMTAQRRDIDDPDVQLEFAQLVGTRERLDVLFLLTVADIRATNPQLWNSFKQSLLQALYRHARLILERGLDTPLPRATVIAERRSKTRTLLDPELVDDPRVERLWESLGDDYLSQYQAADVARHTALLLANAEHAGALVSLGVSPARGAAELLIYVPDDDALFALIATVLESLQLNVLSATLCTTAEGWALDTFDLLERDGSLIDDRHRIEDIREALHRGLSNGTELPPMPEQRASRRLRHFEVATKVHFGDRDDGLTEVRIDAADRPGVLSAISRTFLDTGVVVHSARVTTLGERIDDVYFVSDGHGRGIDDPADRDRLRDELVGRL